MNNNDSDIYVATTEAPTIGDTRKIMSKSWDAATTIKVALEYTKDSHVIDRLTVTSTGLLAATKFAQVGNGIASYNDIPNTEHFYRYSATFQQILSTEATGDVLGGPIFEVYGNFYPIGDYYVIYFRKL